MSLRSSSSLGMMVRMDTTSQSPCAHGLCTSLALSLFHVKWGALDGQVWRMEQVTVYGWSSTASLKMLIKGLLVSSTDLKGRDSRPMLNLRSRRVLEMTEEGSCDIQRICKWTQFVSCSVWSVVKQYWPASCSAIAIISKVQLVWPRCPNSCVRPLNLSTTLDSSSS